MAPLHRREVTDFGSSMSLLQRDLLSEEEGILFDQLHMLFSRLQCRPYRMELSREQQAYLHVIRCKDDWYDVEPRFERDVQEFGVITFDTEDFLPDHAKLKETPANKVRWQDKERLLYVLIGTFKGRVAVFDLEEMSRGPVDTEQPLAALPDSVKRWIRDEEVMVLGSNVGQDFGKLDYRATSLCDTRDVFRHYYGEENGLIWLGETTKSGLGVQAFWAKGFDYKAGKRADHVKLYGDMRYTDKRGRKAWPQERIRTVLYKWDKQRGKLQDFQLHYMWNDATTSVALVVRLAMEMLLNGRLVYKSRPRWAALISRIIGCNVGGYMGEVDDEQVDVEVPPRDSDVQTPAKANSNAVTSVCVPEAEAVEDDVEVVGVLGHPKLTPIAGSSFHYFDADIRRINYYKADPVWPRVCTYCGDPMHSFKNYKKEILCPLMLSDDPNVDKCKYRMCRDKKSHYTPVCRTLHHRCVKCLHRGHLERQLCDEWDEEVWESARLDFEHQADKGVWTKFRRSEERWSFWSHAPGTAFPYYAPHRVLLEEGVLLVNEKLGLQPTRRGFNQEQAPAGTKRPRKAPRKRAAKKRKV